MGCDRNIGDLLCEAQGEGCTGNEDGLRVARFHSAKSRFEIVSRLDVDGQESDPEFTCRQLQRCHCNSDVLVVGDAKHSYPCEIRDDFLEDLRVAQRGRALLQSSD
jgi:hypothetical protein